MTQSTLNASGKGLIAENHRGAETGITFTLTGFGAGVGFVVSDTRFEVVLAGARWILRLKAEESLDYEAATVHNLEIRATDSAGNTDTAEVTIDVTNVDESPTDIWVAPSPSKTNDPPPTPNDLILKPLVFGEDSYNAHIARDAPIGSTIISVVATHPNGDTLTYSLTGGGDLFEIDTTNGDIKLAVSDAQTAPATHILTVTATDTKGSAADITVTITVTITDSAIRGTDASETLNGTDGADAIYGYGDADILYGAGGDDGLYGDAGDDILFGDAGDDTLYGGRGRDSLVGGIDNDILYGDGGWDALSGGTGDDTLYGGSDSDQLHGNEGADIFVLRTDASGSDGVIDFTPSDGDKIRIEEFDGKMPETLDALLTAVNLRVQKGHIRPGGLQSADDDSEIINTAIYKVVDDGDDVLLMVLEDFTDDLTLDMFDLPNINQAPAFAQDSYTATLIKTASADSVVATISATDPEGDALSYSIVGYNPSGLFAINKDGQITLTGALDDATTTRHILTIRAQDEGGDYNDAKVIINVTDANGALHFSANAQHVRFGSKIIDVSVENAVRYSITDGNASGLFEINADGEIILAIPDVATDSTTHTLTIVATDGAGNTTDIIATITDEITRGSDGDDTLYGGAGSDTLYGNEGADIFVLKTDDSGLDVVVDFTPRDGDKIRMEEFDGDMPKTFDDFLTAANLRVEKSPAWQGRHSIYDSYGADNTDIYKVVNGGDDVRVMVLEDFTDDLTLDMFDLPNAIINQAPAFAQDSYTATLIKTATASSVVATIPATDPEGDALSYSIVSHNPFGLFAIDKDGQITLTDALDDATATRHTLTIRAQDEDGDYNDAEVIINITDANGALHFSANTQYAIIGGKIIDVSVENAVSYTITGGNASGLFEINADGEIILTIPDVVTNPATHTLTIVATDGAGNTTDIIATITDEITRGIDGDDVVGDANGIDDVGGGGVTVFVVPDDSDDKEDDSPEDTIEITTAPINPFTISGPPITIFVHNSDKEGDTIYGYGGDDTLYGTSDRDFIYGGSGDDTIYGGANRDRLFGGGDDDTLYGGSGHDFLYGSSGDDTLHGDDGRDHLYGDEGDDTLYGGGERDRLYGNEDDDTLYGGESNDVLSGGDDDDTLYGGGGSDILYGDSGADVFVLNTDDSGADTIRDFRPSGVTFSGDVESPTIITTPGEGDKIRVENFYGAIPATIDEFLAAANLRVEKGDIRTGASAGPYNGGSSSINYLIIVDYEPVHEPKEINNTAIYKVVEGADDVLLMVLEDFSADLTLDMFDLPNANKVPVFTQDSYTADVATDAEIGDTIITAAATDPEGDTLTYTITAGNDAELFDIDEDSGEITLAVPDVRVDPATHTLTITATDTAGNADTATVTITDKAIRGTAGDDVITPSVVAGVPEIALISTIYGYGGADTLRGNGGVDTLRGGDDNDTLYGGDGVVDILYGDAGADTLYGEGGVDILIGGAGTDTLYGGGGIDRLDGGESADIFVLNTADSGADTIVDFTPSEGDKIRMEEFDSVMPARVDAFLTAANLRVEKANIGTGKIFDGADDSKIANTAIYKVVDGGDDVLVMVLEDFTDDLTIDMFDLPNAIPNIIPTFAQDTYTARLAEDAKSGSAVVTAAATDANIGDTLTYSIIGGDEFFAIDDGGQITLTGALDYETATSHTITVEARDSAGATATAKVTINVTDANDNAPIFNKKTQDVMVLEVAAIGTTIATVTARDADTEAGNLRYSILGDRNASPFAINATTGVITLVGELDYEIASTHTLVVQASDGIHTDTSKVVVDVIESQTASLGITTSTDVIDAGTTLTASITHDDPQGYQGGTAPASGWVWFYKSNPETDIGDGSATYTVQAGDAGEQIGVRLTYTDGEGHGDTAETHLTEAVQRVIIKSYAQDAGKDKTYTAETDKATHIEAGGGADHVRDGNRNDVINGGKGDDEIDLSASKTDNDVVIYGIGNQMASDGSDSITSFVRGRDKFVFQIKQSDIDAGNIDLSKDDGYEGFINYVTKGTEDLIDDQFWVNLNFSIGENGVQMDGISFHFKDSTFFSGGRISMPIVSIEFADPLSVDEVREVYSGRDKSTPLVKQGLLSDFDYLDDFLGGDGAVGFEII